MVSAPVQTPKLSSPTLSAQNSSQMHTELLQSTQVTSDEMEAHSELLKKAGTISLAQNLSTESEAAEALLPNARANKWLTGIFNGTSSQRVKKDALWKPLLRSFRIYIRRTLRIYLDIKQIQEVQGDLSQNTQDSCRDYIKLSLIHI